MRNKDHQRLELSVVVPVYNCEECLQLLYQRLKRTLIKITTSFEIVFVEDCGQDSSWEVISKIASQDKCVKGLQLSRNFGQHAAITAGLQESAGEWTVVMDCDLQDPPEEIVHLYAKAVQGYDVVYAKRRQKQQSIFRKLAAKSYFAILNIFNKSGITGEYGSFSIASRKVIDAYLEVKDRDRHYLFILFWLGFKSGDIEYEHVMRIAGRSSYSLMALLKHALNGIFFQTTILLRWIVYLGFGVACVGLILVAFFTYNYFIHSPYPGWTSLAVLILLIGGFSIISTGIAGLYIGRIFEQVKDRPLYVVRKKISNGLEE